MSVVAVVGSRDFNEPELVRNTIWRLMEQPVTIISGGASGVDTFARDACLYFGFHFCHEDRNTIRHLPLPYHFVEFPADWSQGRGAGLRRNSEIVRHASEVIAFLAPGAATPGTSDTIRKAIAAGLPTSVYHEGEWEVTR